LSPTTRVFSLIDVNPQHTDNLFGRVPLPCHSFISLFELGNSRTS